MLAVWARTRQNDVFTTTYLYFVASLFKCPLDGFSRRRKCAGSRTQLAMKKIGHRRIADAVADAQLGAEAVKKLAELRVWLEKGVRPCETRLKYQIEKVLRAASDWES